MEDFNEEDGHGTYQLEEWSEDEHEQMEEEEEEGEENEVSPLLFGLQLKEEGKALLLMGHLEGAIHKFGQALHSLDFLNYSLISQNYSTLLQLKIICNLNIAHCQAKLKSPHIALRYLEKAVQLIRDEESNHGLSNDLRRQLNGMLATALCERGNIFYQLDDFMSAAHSLKEGKALNPQNAQTKHDLEELEQNLKSKYHNVEDFEKLMEKMHQEQKTKEYLERQSILQKKLELLNSGFFGGKYEDANNVFLLRRREQTGKLVMPNVTQKYLPNSGPKTIDRYVSRAYSGQFSEDGSLFYSTCQDFNVRLYTTDNMKFKLRKSVRAIHGQWTLTDAILSTDNRFLIYSSITPFVNLYKLDLDASDQETEARQEYLDFSGNSTRGFGIWSIRFSNDNREIIAGTSDCSLYIFDVERKDKVRMVSHSDEVNAVAFAQPQQSNIFLSGSDDHMIYLWDRRSSKKPEAALVGHSEGITYLSSKGDGIYVLSNAKDQTMKLWDLRKCTRPWNKYKPKPSKYHWDYRGMEYPGDPQVDRHPSDHSVLTLVGHRVLRTLIRCHWSPAATTGQRYCYTGSADGNIRIYDLSGGVASHLRSVHSVVRDVSMHPLSPDLVATSWDGTLYHFTYQEQED